MTATLESVGDIPLAEEPAGDGRPTTLLPWRQLALIAAYWFGISAIWGGYETFGQKQVWLLVGEDLKGSAIAILELMGGLVALAVVPTVGAISDYTTSRFGRRKGYIITGATFDLLFLTGLALVSVPEPPPGTWDGQRMGSLASILLYVLFFLGLQFSSNVAQGPFQGFVPDLVAEPQVGRASGLVGAMRTTGLVGGSLVMLTIGVQLNLWGLALVVIGLIEFGLAILTFRFVPNGPPGKSRGGRRWRTIAAETWGTDVLRERSFLNMTAVRFLFLMGTGIFVNINLLYIEISLGQEGTWRTIWMYAALGAIVIGTVSAAIVAAHFSDRTGRKPVIWAAAAIASAGILVIAIAETPLIAVPGVFLLGVGSGAYLAVDWALMTEIIPLASSGRYMGLANIANSLSGPLGLVLAGPLIDLITAAGDREMAQRVALALGIPMLALAAALLTRVHPRRDPRSEGGTASAPAGA
jgi:MFS family permease